MAASAQDPRKLQEFGSARPTVVRTHKGDPHHSCSVVVTREDYHFGASTRQDAYDIDHRNGATWRIWSEWLTLHFGPSGHKLGGDVLSGSLKGGRPRWTRTHRHEPFQVLESSRPVEALRRSTEVKPCAMVDCDKRNHHRASRNQARKTAHFKLLLNTAATAS